MRHKLRQQERFTGADMELTVQEKIYLIEQMNNLNNDPLINAVRYRAVKWVNARLESALVAKIQADCGLSSEQWENFVLGQDPAFQNVRQALLNSFFFSREEQRKLCLMGKNDKLPLAKLQANIAAEMKAYLMNKERIEFRKMAEITPAAWQRFMDVSGYTSNSVIDQIADALALTAEESEIFRALVFHDTFNVTDDFKKYIRKNIKDKELSFSEFLLNAEISKNAWEPFLPDSKKLTTSQATLLKLILGLRMDQPSGGELLHRVNSDFVMRRDLAVLICINSGIFEPEECFYILEFFAEGYGGERCYKNIFSKS